MKIRMMNVRCKETLACAGTFAFNAEMEVMVYQDDHSCPQTLFVSADYFDGFTSYAVCKTSMLAYLTSEDECDDLPERVEEYDNIVDATASDFCECFIYLDKLLGSMGNDMSKEKGFYSKLEYQKRDVDESVESKYDYKFCVTDSFKLDGKVYIATVSYFSAPSLTGIEDVSNKKCYQLKAAGRVLLEQYNDLDESCNSQFYILFCDMERSLREHIQSYLEDNRIGEIEVLCDDDIDYFNHLLGTAV